ncbi:MAG: PQQ-dependent sugar dehydrogenase, partial [Gemmataceae bacterium]
GPFYHQSEDYASVTFMEADAKSFGIEKRDPLTTSTVVGFPDPPPAFRAERVMPGYKAEFPIQVVRIPGTEQALLITQPRAYGPTTVWRFPMKADVQEKEAVKLFDTPYGGTATDLCFHPKFAENGYVYIGYSGKPENEKKKRCYITRYTVAKPDLSIDTKTAKTIIDWESDGHNGCAICFDNDGLMYVTTGDGTSDSDTNVTGQRIDLLLAKILRIDVDKPADGKEYSVPKDNPFVNDKRFTPETWAYGMRNPWRITFDAKSNQLWLGQNGQDLWEYAHLVQKGDNYGWSVFEGSHDFYPERKLGPTPHVKPTVEHHHSEARSLTGGVVYRGKKLPELEGAYIYGDYSTGHIWAVKHDGKAIVWHKKIAITTLKITAFAFDKDGELIVCHHSGKDDGGFFTLVPNTEKAATAFPKKLSESGLFDSVKDHKMKPSVVPYSVNATFWSDGAHKERFVALPPGEGIELTGNRGWKFPDRTVLVKSFALETTEGDAASRKWIETRFMTKQAGEWYGYSYVWNDDGTDATLLDAKGMDKTFTIKTANGERKQTWHYPSRAECMVCHSRAQNYVLGLCELQMNKTHTYPSGRSNNQIREFEHLGMFKVDWLAENKGRIPDDAKPQADQRPVKASTLLNRPPSAFTKALVDPYDQTQKLDARARSWLHANCSSCHVEAGGGNALMELEFSTAFDKMRIANVDPVHTKFDIKDAKLLVPGSPEKSILVHRLGQRGEKTGQMPPLASSRVDETGLALMREWVKSLEK